VEELFDAFFGGGGGRRRPRGPRRGADLQMRVQLTFMEAVFGSSRDLHLKYQVRDEKGKIVTKDREVTVETPAGVDTGMNLRLSGQGAEGDPGAPRGNLLVQVIVEDDEYFHRDGYDVHTEVPISVCQAILGGTVDVRTLTGVVEMKIPKGTQPESKLMLRGKGIPVLNSTSRKGNQIVHLKIQIPKKINERQEQLLREFDDETKACGGGIFGRLTDAGMSTFKRFFGGASSSESRENDKNETKGNKKEGNSSKKEDNDSSVEDEEPKKQAI